MGIVRFYESYSRALNQVSPREFTRAEVNELLRLARATEAEAKSGKIPQSEVTSVRNQLENLFETTRPDRNDRPPLFQIDPKGFVALQKFLGKQPKPAPTTIPSATLLPASELHPTLIPYGRKIGTTGIPPFLSRSAPSIAGAIFPFGTDAGTGIHLGKGLVLTARHVSDQWMRETTPKKELIGKQSLDAYRPGWTLRVAPERGAYVPMSGLILIDPASFGRWNDWTLVQGPELAGSAAHANIRKTSTLAPGERIWIVGDHTSAARVTTGVLGEIKGNNALLRDCPVEGGFSGSPAFDSEGNLVGIVYGKFGDDAQMITTDAILATLGKAERKLPELRGLLQKASS
jgi:hypothetical protein